MQMSHHISLITIAIILILLLVIVFFLVLLLRKRGSESNSEVVAEQLYIGNLPYRTSERDLQKQFAQYGHIESVRVVRDRHSGRSKGYAFITFSCKREAGAALEAHGKALDGRTLVVHVAKSRK